MLGEPPVKLSYMTSEARLPLLIDSNINLPDIQYSIDVQYYGV